MSSPRVANLVVAILLATLILPASPAGVVADHGGRPITAQFNCDRPVTPPRCTSVGDNPRHLVFFDSSVTPELAASMRATMAEDYGATKLVVLEQARLTRMTDVVVFSDDYGENGAAGWVYCPTGAPQGTNPSGDRWCRQQELHLNLNARYASYFADDGSRDYVTCHEMGHTVGLRHWGNPPQTSGTDVAATCMNANTPDGPTDLHQFDIDHINGYAYRRAPSPRHRLLPAPVEPPQVRLRSWAGHLDATEVEAATSLTQLIGSADAVVRGRIVAVAPGRAYAGLHYAAATVEVAELLAGTAGPSLTLEIPLFDGPESVDRLPDWGEAIFFLRNKGASARAAGLTRQFQSEQAPFYRLMSFTSLVVNDAGVAVTDPDAPLLAGLAGKRFEIAAKAISALGG